MGSKRWIPLVLIWLGVIWLAQMGAAQAGGHGVWIVGKGKDVGVLAPGEVAETAVTVVNLSVGGVEAGALPSCGCTVLDEPRVALGAFGWKRIPLRIDTAGLAAGANGTVLRLRFRRGEETWQKDVLLRFTMRKSVSPFEGVKRLYIQETIQKEVCSHTTARDGFFGGAGGVDDEQCVLRFHSFGPRERLFVGPLQRMPTGRRRNYTSCSLLSLPTPAKHYLMRRMVLTLRVG